MFYELAYDRTCSYQSDPGRRRPEAILMARQVAVFVVLSEFFGAGLARSGMVDAACLRDFFALTTQWDPTLIFVMAGSLIPMGFAWLKQRTPKENPSGSYP